MCRKSFGFRQKVPGRIVDQNVERSFRPNLFDRFLDIIVVPHVARERFAGSSGRSRQIFGGLLDDFEAASADVDHRAKPQISLGDGPADACASTRNENTLVLEKISMKHEG